LQVSSTKLHVITVYEIQAFKNDIVTVIF